MPNYTLIAPMQPATDWRRSTKFTLANYVDTQSGIYVEATNATPLATVYAPSANFHFHCQAHIETITPALDLFWVGEDDVVTSVTLPSLEGGVAIELLVAGARVELWIGGVRSQTFSFLSQVDTRKLSEIRVRNVQRIYSLILSDSLEGFGNITVDVSDSNINAGTWSSETTAAYSRDNDDIDVTLAIDAAALGPGVRNINNQGYIIPPNTRTWTYIPFS